jgi:UDP-N-acetylmuramyl pentapeptide synthase
MQEYARAKANLFRFQKSSDIAFLPRVATHEKIFKNALHGRVVRFTSTPSTDIGETPWHIHPNSISAAVAIAKSLGISSAHIITRLRTFAGAPGRRERVCKSRLGVTCINDTTATAPIAAIDTICSASDTFGKAHIIAIVGGHDKELRESEIRTLASSIKRCTKPYLPNSCINEIGSCRRNETCKIRRPRYSHAGMCEL